MTLDERIEALAVRLGCSRAQVCERAVAALEDALDADRGRRRVAQTSSARVASAWNEHVAPYCPMGRVRDTPALRQALARALAHVDLDDILHLFESGTFARMRGMTHARGFGLLQILGGDSPRVVSIIAGRYASWKRTKPTGPEPDMSDIIYGGKRPADWLFPPTHLDRMGIMTEAHRHSLAYCRRMPAHDVRFVLRFVPAGSIAFYRRHGRGLFDEVGKLEGVVGVG